MTCIICKGNKTVIKNDQTEICDNCEGSGEVETKVKTP